MSTATRVAGFLVGVVALFGASFAVGSAVGPVGAEPVGHESGHDAGHETGHDAGHDAGHGSAAPRLPGALSSEQDGYRLVLDDTTLPAGRDRSLAFRVEGPDGAAVTAYDVEHEKLLHLVVVRRDLQGFQHVHPVLGDDGTWRVPVDLTPGSWRVIADTAPTGAEPLTLGTDLLVPGQVRAPADLPERRVATVDGYTVTLTGDLVAGEHSPLTLEVTRDGEPVTDLQPYLGAYGHLVALREGDLAYLHVHPAGDPGPGPRIAFEAEVPSVGDYQLFLDFRHDDVVRTARLSLEATRP